MHKTTESISCTGVTRSLVTFRLADKLIVSVEVHQI